jgi:uncharacterized membrane protein
VFFLLKSKPFGFVYCRFISCPFYFGFIRVLSTLTFTVTSVEMGLRRRALTVLLLPIVVFIFMVGWVLFWMGKQQNRGSVEELRRKRSASEGADTTEEGYVEVGLIEDLMEKTASDR